MMSQDSSFPDDLGLPRLGEIEIVELVWPWERDALHAGVATFLAFTDITRAPDTDHTPDQED